VFFFSFLNVCAAFFFSSYIQTRKIIMKKLLLIHFSSLEERKLRISREGWWWSTFQPSYIRILGYSTSASFWFTNGRDLDRAITNTKRLVDGPAGEPRWNYFLSFMSLIPMLILEHLQKSTGPRSWQITLHSFNHLDLSKSLFQILVLTFTFLGWEFFLRHGLKYFPERSKERGDQNKEGKK